MGLVVGKVIKAVYWKSNMMLARLATLCEYQLLKSVDLERIAGRLRVAPRELSAAGILLQGVSGELEETTRLYNFAGELPKRMCTKLSNLDVRQGVGYDLTQDEDAVMSKMCLLSPQIARLGMRRLGTVPISTVKCFFAILRHCR